MVYGSKATVMWWRAGEEWSEAVFDELVVVVGTWKVRDEADSELAEG